jgi:trans-aconitate 2-methyltransferase
MDYPTRDAQRSFYDDFAHSRMAGYLEGVNPRLRMARDRILSLVRSDSRILDVGCGVGVVTREIARRAPAGMTFACDLSAENIRIAGARRTTAHVEYKVLDVLNDFEAVREWVGGEGSLDLITLVDVIEHIPVARHSTLLEHLRTLLGEGGHVVLTFPTPAYQQYLRANDPGELQPIDEDVDPLDLCRVAEQKGFIVRQIDVCDVWRRNQYAHVVLGTAGGVDRIPPPYTLQERLKLRLRSLLRRRR